MTREELIEELSETLLWNVVSEHIVDLNQLSHMLKDIGYLDNKEAMIARVTGCEVLVSDFFKIVSFKAQWNKIQVFFEMPFILSAWDDSVQLLRVTSTAAGSCLIPDVGYSHWDRLETEELGLDDWLEEPSLVEIKELIYIDSECDDVSFLSM